VEVAASSTVARGGLSTRGKARKGKAKVNDADDAADESEVRNEKIKERTK
jgi:hypothetical protein